MEIGLITFGRLKTEITGFKIFENLGYQFDEDKLNKILQLPKEIDFTNQFENSLLFSVNKVQDNKNGQQHIFISKYKYTGLDNDNRQTYVGSCLYFISNILPPESIITILDKLLLISEKQQSNLTYKIDNQLVLEINSPTFNIENQKVDFIEKPFICNMLSNQINIFIENSLNELNYRYRTLYCTDDIEFLENIKLEKLNILINNESLIFIKNLEENIKKLNEENNNNSSQINSLNDQIKEYKEIIKKNNRHLNELSEKLNNKEKELQKFSKKENEPNPLDTNLIVKQTNILKSYFEFILIVVVITVPFIVSQITELSSFYKIIIAYIPNLLLYFLSKKQLQKN